MAVARKIAYNILINTVSKALSIVLALIGIGLITRYLGKEDFGNYATAIAFFALFGSLADLGIYSIATREISRPGADERKIMGNVFALRITASLIVFLLVPLFVYFLPYPEKVKTAIFIVASAFLFSSSYAVLNGIFQKNLAMDKVAIAELIGKATQLTVVFLSVKNNLGFNFIVASVFAAMLVNFVLIYLWSRRYLIFNLQFNFSYWKKFLRESLPMGVSVIVSFMYFRIDTILLSLMKNSSDVGIYNAAYKVMENLAFFPGMIMGLILPLTSYNIISNRKRFEFIANKVFRLFVLLVVPIVLGAVFLSDKIIALIGGSGFEESSLVLKILVFSLAFIFFGTFSNIILLSSGLQKKLMYALSFCAFFNITLNLVLIPRFSYLGSAFVSVATEMLVVLITFYLMARYIFYRPVLEKGGRIFLSGLTMTVFLYFFREAGFFFQAVGSVLTYSFMLWLTGAVSIAEMKIILRSPEKQ